MDCSWWSPGYWIGWHWIPQILWLLLFIGVGFLVIRALRNGNRKSNRVTPISTGLKLQETCPNCGAPVEKEFIRCPECHYKLKINCPSCGKIVKTSWEICPYCEAELPEETTKNKKRR